MISHTSSDPTQHRCREHVQTPVNRKDREDSNQRTSNHARIVEGRGVMAEISRHGVANGMLCLWHAMQQL